MQGRSATLANSEWISRLMLGNLREKSFSIYRMRQEDMFLQEHLVRLLGTKEEADLEWSQEEREQNQVFDDSII